MNLSPLLNNKTVFSPSMVKTSKLSDNNTDLKLKSPLTSDVFQKSSISFSGVKNISFEPWSDEKVSEVYNKTFDKVVSQTPILNELNIKKPELVFDDKKDNYIAGYRFAMNCVSVSPFIKEPQCFIGLYDDEGNLKQPVSVIPKSKVNDYAEYFANNKNIRGFLLNESEKEAYIGAAFAHELRHWVQTHLVASVEGSSDIYLTSLKNSASNMRTDLAELKEYMDAIEADSSSVAKDIELLEYGISYEPKKLLDKNTKLKLSLHPADTRYFSVNKHFARSLFDNSPKTGSEAYRALPHEADAFNYQFEYFNELAQNAEKSGMRKDVAGAILKLMYDDACIGMMKMSEYGHDPVIFE